MKIRSLLIMRDSILDISLLFKYRYDFNWTTRMYDSNGSLYFINCSAQFIFFQMYTKKRYCYRRKYKNIESYNAVDDKSERHRVINNSRRDENRSRHVSPFRISIISSRSPLCAERRKRRQDGETRVSRFV